MIEELKILARDYARRWRGEPISKYEGLIDFVRWRLTVRAFKRDTSWKS